jgi:hypothetical protein
VSRVGDPVIATSVRPDTATVELLVSLEHQLAACRPAQQWNGPEAGFSVNKDVLPSSLSLVTARHPELKDLVRDGRLLVHTRPENYQDRRTDGYLHAPQPDAFKMIETGRFIVHLLEAVLSICSGSSMLPQLHAHA